MAILLFCLTVFFGYAIRQMLCMGSPPATAKSIADSITVGCISTLLYLPLAIAGLRLIRDFDGRDNPFSLHILLWFGIAIVSLTFTYGFAHIFDPYLPDFLV